MKHPLVEKYGRAELGIDGNAAFALLGPNIQEGECEFVELPPNWTTIDELRGCRLALARLRDRLGIEHIQFRFARSHPYGD